MTDVKLIPACEIPDEHWDQASLDLGGWFYHTAAWRRLLVRSFASMDDVSVGFLRGDRLIALLPLIRVSRFGVSKAFSMPFSLAGLIGDHGEAVEKCMLDYLARTAHAFQFNCPAPLPFMKAKGLHDSVVSVVNLDRSEEEILASISESLRRNIRQKADRVTLRPARGEDDLRTIQAIYRERMKSLNSPGTYNGELLAGIMALPEAWRKITIASVNNGPDVAFNIGLFRGGPSFFFANASRDGYADLRVNIKLMWDEIKWARESGSKLHYLGGGVGGRNDSLRDYKLRWGRPEPEYCLMQANGLMGCFVEYAQKAAGNRLVGLGLRMLGIR